MSKVYVVQVPARRTGINGAWQEKYDLRPAEEYGELVRMLDYGNVPVDPEPTRKRLFGHLSKFDTREDHLLLLGDPVACAQAVHVMGYDLTIDDFSVLKWDRREARYYPYRVTGA